MCVCVGGGGGEGGGRGGGRGPHELKVGWVRKLLVLWNSEPKIDPSMISSGGMFTIESWCTFVEGEGRGHTINTLLALCSSCMHFTS